MTDFQQVEEKTNNVAGISNEGEQYVSSRYYSKAYNVIINDISIAFEIVPAQAGKKFIITSMLLATSKTFGSATTAETLNIYEASPADLATELGIIAQIDFLKNDRLVATSLNIAASDSVSIVASATDTDVNVTISGYYVNI